MPVGFALQSGAEIPKSAEVKLSRRIGAYGGTFDPVHIGHVEIARAVMRYFALDCLLIIPAYKPPHKNLEAISRASHRFEMAALAFQNEPRITVSRMEMDAPERPYTVQTMQRLQDEYGEQTRLFFVMGADSFAEITLWREYQQLLSRFNIIVVTRPGSSISWEHLPAEAQQRVIDVRGKREEAAAMVREADGFVYLTDFVNNSVSATEIRRRVQNGESIKGLTTPAVIEYIEEHKLYL